MFATGTARRLARVAVIRTAAFCLFMCLLPVSGIPFPGGVARNAAALPGAESYYLPKNGALPDSVLRRLPAFKRSAP